VRRRSAGSAHAPCRPRNRQMLCSWEPVREGGTRQELRTSLALCGHYAHISGRPYIKPPNPAELSLWCTGVSMRSRPSHTRESARTSSDGSDWLHAAIYARNGGGLRLSALAGCGEAGATMQSPALPYPDASAEDPRPVRLEPSPNEAGPDELPA
jgi:hypothetical protein